MKLMFIYCICYATVFDVACNDCTKKNWTSTFNKQGLSSCGDTRLIRGFFRAEPGTPDYINFLQAAKCCNMTRPWKYLTQTVYADWSKSLTKNNSKSECPLGYFLRGLYRSRDNNGLLSNIEEGQCSKSGAHPNYYDRCFNKRMHKYFDKKSLGSCPERFFVTGLHRGNCSYLRCITHLRCCSMASGQQPLDDLDKIKTLVMDITMLRIANLAHYLGYGWCCGCNSEYVGEDFIKTGDTWVAENGRHCKGYMSNHRLSMAYGDWSFGIKDIKYSDPIIDVLKPETIDTGVARNRDNSPVTTIISRTETVVESVTHTTTSSWKMGAELGLQFTFPEKGGVTYKTSFEHSQMVQDSKGKQNSNTFTISNSKTLAANSSAKWTIVLSKSRTTMSYRAVILIRFSTELQGFLRWGGGYDGDTTNFHKDYRGSEDRPPFNYRFGDSKTPFYTALKQQSETNSLPWQWTDMLHRYSKARSLINSMINEDNYVFTLTGKFESVQGTKAEISWDAVETEGKRSVEEADENPEENVKNKRLLNVAAAGPDDAPAPDPPPPPAPVNTLPDRSSFDETIIATGD